jgi:hypothetical protein
MAASAGIATPIVSLRVVGTVGAQAPIRRIIEKAGQTFLIGTPVQIDLTTGSVQACPAITSVATAVIAGFSTEPASNLATTGIAQTLTYGSVQNQPGAVLIPVGAPPNDGTVGFLQALPENVFVGRLGNSVTAATSVVLATDMGAIFGLTKDATTLEWYIDKGITTLAAGACVQITDVAGINPAPVLNSSLDPIGTLNGREGFVVLAAAQQIY